MPFIKNDTRYRLSGFKIKLLTPQFNKTLVKKLYPLLNTSALSVLSQGKSISLRPKWPYAAVGL